MQVLLLVIMQVMQLVAAADMVNDNTTTSLDQLMECHAVTGCQIKDVNATFTNLSATQQLLDTRG
jgi:hypothetical protein